MTSKDAKIESVRNSSNQDEVIYTAKNDIDWQVRRVAVEKINDENVLKDIVNDELTSAVAIKAMEHIDDKEFLSDICLNHPDAYVRLACINRMSDESLLLKKDLTSLLDKILFNDPNDIVLKSVCENPYLDNRESLTKAVFTIENEDIKRLLIRKITDEDMLADFALNSENKFLRLEAIQNPNLTDLDTISEIIIHDSDEFNRAMAIYKITNEESLLEIILRKPLHHRLPQIAQNTNLSDDYFLEILNDGTDEYACQVAAAFISDGEMLENIVLSKSSDKIRADAIRNSHFTNQKILDELIVTKTSPEILFEAISKIENQDVLEDYILNHLQHDEITAKAISRVDGTDFLRDLSTHPDSGIRLEAVKRISQFGDADGILRDIALTEDNEEICLKAVSAMKIRNDLIEVAKSRPEKNIRISALRHVADKRLIYNYFKSDIAHSGEFTPAEFALNEMALEDNDDDVKIIATGKVMDKELLDDIAAGEDVNRFEAQKRLNSLFEDIKQIEHKQILSRLIQSPDKDISAVAQATLDDLDLWEDRLSKVNEIDDINTLKDIARNDFNYFVRMEAEGKLEKMLFHIRMDEIDLESSQEELKAIASDGEFSREIRRSALLKITDHAFVEKFENII